jgi:diguanylate cyclase (GGDEF)-like protein
MMNSLAEGLDLGNALTLQAERELARKVWQLAFSPELEARYRLDLAADRSRELRNIVRVGIFLYLSAGILMKLAGITHETWPTCAIQLIGALAVVLVILRYFCQPNIADPVRETAVLICCLLASLASILVSYVTPETMMQDLIIAALPANFVLMFMRLRFPFAAVFAVVSFSCYSIGIILRPEMAPQKDAFLIGFMAMLCLPALIGVHALERASRRLYLHGLLQQLRVARMAVENDTLTVLALTDPLTKVANRRRLDMELRAFCEATPQHGALLMIDVDRFKAFNDLYGHQAGDVCLQQVAERLGRHLRQCDLLARFGGEEFAVLLPSVAAEEATSTAERLRAAIAAQPFEIDGAQVYVSMSIGIAALDAYTTPNALLAAADIALYAAKNAGRNQVRVATPAARS